MTRLLLHPMPQLREVGPLLVCRGYWSVLAWSRQQIDVDAENVVRVRRAKLRADVAAPVATLRREASIAEDVGHQSGEGIGNLRDIEPRLVRPE